jgi:hypothetical protein
MEGAVVAGIHMLSPTPPPAAPYPSFKQWFVPDAGCWDPLALLGVNVSSAKTAGLGIRHRPIPSVAESSALKRASSLSLDEEE